MNCLNIYLEAIMDCCSKTIPWSETAKTLFKVKKNSKLIIDNDYECAFSNEDPQFSEPELVRDYPGIDRVSNELAVHKRSDGKEYYGTLIATYHDDIQATTISLHLHSDDLKDNRIFQVHKIDF